MSLRFGYAGDFHLQALVRESWTLCHEHDLPFGDFVVILLDIRGSIR